MALSRTIASFGAALALLLLPACGQGGANALLNALDQGQQSRSFDPAELDGLWVGRTIPLDPYAGSLELTLGFLSDGPSPNAVALTDYSYPDFDGAGTVDYLALLDRYDLSFGPTGHLTLDTTVRQFLSNGVLLEENTYFDLFMSDDGQQLIGTQILSTTLNGRPDLHLSFLLTMNRQL